MSLSRPFIGFWSHTGLIDRENSLEKDAFPISSRSSRYTTEFRAGLRLPLHSVGACPALTSKRGVKPRRRSDHPCQIKNEKRACS